MLEALKELYLERELTDVFQRRQELCNFYWRKANMTNGVKLKMGWIKLTNDVLKDGDIRALEKKLKNLLK